MIGEGEGLSERALKGDINGRGDKKRPGWLSRRGWKSAVFFTRLLPVLNPEASHGERFRGEAGSGDDLSLRHRDGGGSGKEGGGDWFDGLTLRKESDLYGVFLVGEILLIT